MMRKLWVIAFFACVALFGAYAQTIAVVTEVFPPYNFLTDKGLPTGGAAECVQAILKEAGYADLKIEFYPWARAYEMAQITSGDKVTLIFSMGRTPARESLFKWVGIVGPYDVFMYSLASRIDISVKTLDDARKYKLGTTKNDAREQYLVSKGFTIDGNLDSGSDNATNLKKLISGRIDLWPIAELVAMELAKKEGIDYSKLKKAFALADVSNGLWFAASLNAPDAMVAKLTKAYAKLKAAGTFKAIWAKYGVTM